VVGVRDWGGGLQAAELVFVVGEFVGWWVGSVHGGFAGRGGAAGWG